VTEFFKSLLLSFSPNLDEANPDIPEWRQDVGRVIKKSVLQVSGNSFSPSRLSLSFLCSAQRSWSNISCGLCLILCHFHFTCSSVFSFTEKQINLCFWAQQVKILRKDNAMSDGQNHKINLG